ncbi:MAG: hypothetical protein RSA06_00160 [Erysipelotrichaceae bacterium]
MKKKEDKGKGSGLNIDLSTLIESIKSFDIERIKGLSKDSLLSSGKSLLRKNATKEKPIKREFKQIEKGAIMIVCSIVAGYLLFTFIYKPINEEFIRVETLQIESNNKRNMIQQQVEGKELTKKRITLMKKELKKFKDKYPNARTQNEVVLIVSNLIEKSGVKPTSISIGTIMPVQNSQIATTITQKNVQGNLADPNYFMQSATPEGEAAPVDPTTAPKANFEYSLLGLTVSEISKEKAYEIVSLIRSNPRIIIADSLKVHSADDGATYTIDGQLYFYAYRQDALVDLFN